MVNAISILGSTGSIGKQTINVAKRLNLPVKAISVQKSVALAEQQARELKPEMVAVFDADAAKELAFRLSDTDIRVVAGEEGFFLQGLRKSHQGGGKNKSGAFYRSKNFR